MDSEDIPGSIPLPLDSGRKVIFRQTFQLSASTVVLQVSRFAKNLLLAGILGPAYFGLWNGLQVFITYGMNAHLGVLQAMGREIPLSRGSGAEHRIPDLANAALTASLVLSALGAVLTAGAGFAMAGLSVGPLPPLLLIPVIITQMVFLFGQSLLRAEDEFGLLSGTLAITAALELGLTIVCVSLFGFSGVLAGLALSQAIGAFVSLRRKRQYPLRITVDFTVMRELLRIGFPIMLTILGYFVLTTVDRLFIIAYVGSAELGYYALGSLAITALGYIPIAVNQVMYPKFAMRFGETGDPAALAGYLRVPAITIAHGMGLVLGIAGLSLPLVTLVLPEYIPGITSARILLAGFFFIAITGSSANLLLTINKQFQYVAILAAAIALVISLDITALVLDFGIEGVAVATAATNLLYAIVLIQFTTRKHLPAGSNPFGLVLAKLFLPWCLGLLLALGVSAITVGGTIPTVLVQVFAFASVYVPLSLLLLRREKIW